MRAAFLARVARGVPAGAGGRTALLLAALLGPASAAALPVPGQPIAPVVVVDQDAHARPLPDPRLPTLVFYEDKDAGKQNQTAHDRVGALADKPGNQGKVDILAVADVSKWDWFPAHNFAIAEIRKIARRENATIYCDWKGTVRKQWGLTRGKSGVVLLGADGRVRFAGEGPLSEAQLGELLERLAELGLK
jgi:hypothetical protein